MKKYIFLLGFALLIGFTATAQWTSGGGISYTTDKVGIGTATPEVPLHMLDGVAGSIAIQEKVLNTNAGASLIMRKARGTIASKLTPLNNDIIGGLFGLVWQGTAYRPSATLRFFVDGDVTGASTAGKIIFQTQPAGSSANGTLLDRMIIRENGFVGIGTNNPQSLLSVNGKVSAKEVEVTLSGWSDFVFASDYTLRPLSEVESFIAANRHLPDVPSEAQVLENGMNVGEMSATLLQKIEELTLYIIDLNKRIAELEK